MTLISIEVNSFHNFRYRVNIWKNLIPLAHDNEDNIEAFCNPKKDYRNVWHPEREVDRWIVIAN